MKDRDTGATKDNLYKGTHTHRPPAPNKVPGFGKAAASGPAAAVLAKQSANVMSAMTSAGSAEAGSEAEQPSGSQQALEQLRREGSNLAFASPKSPSLPRLDVLSALVAGASSSGELPAVSTPGSGPNPLLPVEPLSRAASAALDSTSSAPPTPLSTPSKASRPLAMPKAIPLQPGLSPPPARKFPGGASSAAAALCAAVEELEKPNGGSRSPGNGLKRPLPSDTPVSPGGAGGSSKRRKSGAAPAVKADADEEETLGVPEPYEALSGRLADMHENGDSKMVMWIKTEMDILEDGYRYPPGPFGV